MAKIGRNERCPCGSGKKYRRCCGSPDGRSHLMAGFDKARARADAQRVQRERQQGLGKPIISVDFNGRRLVAVKNRLLHSRRWLTFQDFLLDYIKIAIGSEWGNAEIAKPLEHPTPQNNFQPRVGFAYSLNEKTTIRSGYGLFYTLSRASVRGSIGTGFSSQSTVDWSRDSNLTTTNLCLDSRGEEYLGETCFTERWPVALSSGRGFGWLHAEIVRSRFRF